MMIISKVGSIAASNMTKMVVPDSPPTLTSKMVWKVMRAINGLMINFCKFKWLLRMPTKEVDENRWKTLPTVFWKSEIMVYNLIQSKVNKNNSKIILIRIMIATLKLIDKWMHKIMWSEKKDQHWENLQSWTWIEWVHSYKIFKMKIVISMRMWTIFVV